VMLLPFLLSHRDANRRSRRVDHAHDGRGPSEGG